MDAALDQMQAMGVNTVRIGIPWAGVNPIPGYYNWSQDDYLINAADARGMGVLADIHDLMVANGDGGKLIWASEYGDPPTAADPSKAPNADQVKRRDARAAADANDAPKESADTQKKRPDQSPKNSADEPRKSRHDGRR
jgi:hypothetical protein